MADTTFYQTRPDLKAIDLGEDRFAVGVVPLGIADATTEQTTNSGDLVFGFTARRACGQRLTISDRLVTKLSFRLHKKGAPTGDVYFRIRKVSDNSVLSEQLWGQAEDLPAEGAPDWVEATFDTPVNVNEEVRILAEASTGASSTNSIKMRYEPSDVKASEYLTYGVPPGSWVNATAVDGAYKYTYPGGIDSTFVNTRVVAEPLNNRALKAIDLGDGTYALGAVIV